MPPLPRSITRFHAHASLLSIAYTPVHDDPVSCKANGGLISMEQLSARVPHNYGDASPRGHRPLCVCLSVIRAWQLPLTHAQIQICSATRTESWPKNRYVMNGKERFAEGGNTDGKMMVTDGKREAVSDA